MADIDGQLGIRSRQDGLDERVLVKINDATNPDAAGAGQAVSDGKSHTRIHGSDSDGTDQEALLSQEGHVQSNGDYDVTNNKRPSSQGLIVSDRSASTDETTMNKRPTAVLGNDDKVAIDFAISDSSGNRIDEENPLAVFLAENPGDEITDFDQSAAVASDASTNHDYVVSAGLAFKNLNISATSTGYAKFELQIEDGVGVGTYTTKQVLFNSPSNSNVSFDLKKPQSFLAGVTIRLIKTNLDNKAQDLYSTINGIEA